MDGEGRVRAEVGVSVSVVHCGEVGAGLCKEVVLLQRCFMCVGEHYGEVGGLVSVHRWYCSRGASCVVGEFHGPL